MRNGEVIRQWQILREIETRRHGVTIHELATLVDVSTRTIRRDLQALQQAGFAIYDEGDAQDTKRWRMDGTPLKGLQDGLSVTDVAALYLSRILFEGVSGWPLEDELTAAFAKIEAALNPSTRTFLSTLPDVISTKAGPRAQRNPTDVTRRLFQATHDQRVVTMSYFSASAGQQKTYLVEPYRLALALGSLYLLAFVPAYDAFRTFAVERIETLSLGEETFKKTRALPDAPFDNSLGVFSGSPERIVLQFDRPVALYVGSRIWHDSQVIETLPGGRIQLELQVTRDPALLTWVLGFGRSVRVIEPPALVAAVTAEHREALARYDGAGVAGTGSATRDPDTTFV